MSTGVERITRSSIRGESLNGQEKRSIGALNGREVIVAKASKVDEVVQEVTQKEIAEQKPQKRQREEGADTQEAKLNATSAKKVNHSPDIHETLRGWVITSDRKIAKGRIEIFLQNSDQDTLILSDLTVNLLPDIFSYPAFQRLHVLDLGSASLKSLPESIGELTALHKLDLSFNKLVSLPESIGRLNVLTVLKLEGGKLTSLPSSIGDLLALQELDLSYNDLTFLPQFIGRLRALRVLNLKSNPLTDLHVSILRLPINCEVNLKRARLSQVILNRLRIATSASNYQGPQLFHDVLHASWIIEERSIEELLQEIYVFAKEDQENLDSLTSDGARAEILKSWLNRLSWRAEASKKEAKEVYYKRMIHILKLANSHAEFREIFWNILQDASETYEDRTSSSVLLLNLLAWFFQQLATENDY